MKEFVAISVFLAAALAAQGADGKCPQRWNNVGGDCSTDDGTLKLMVLLEKSKAAGCTHVLLPESHLCRLAEQKPAYFRNAARLQASARAMGLTLVPAIVSVGDSGRYFHYDSNLAEGIPVRNMPYLVKGAEATPDPALALDTGTMKTEGNVVSGAFKVKPFMLYRVSFELAGAPGDPEDFVRVTSSGGKRWNSRSNPVTVKDGGKTVIMTIFNTLEGDEINVRIAPGADGRIANLKIDPAGMLLILRRARIPLTVTSEDGMTAYLEGEDFQKVEDPIVAARPFPGDFPIDHAAPTIRLTPDSKIKDGQKLLVSFWHHQRVYADQDCMSMEDPAAWDVLEKEIGGTVKAWPTGNYFLSYNEIRVGGWEPMPDPGIKTPGQLLAWHFKKAYDLVRTNAPCAYVYTWSDMFTPGHNAYPFETKGYHYLVNGNWDGAWEGLPKDVVVMNWHSPDATNVRFFADRGHSQVLCGYYDVKDAEAMKRNIRDWMTVSDGVPQVQGLMYTTKCNAYGNMKEYFQLLDSYDQWAAVSPAGEPAQREVRNAR